MNRMSSNRALLFTTLAFASLCAFSGCEREERSQAGGAGAVAPSPVAEAAPFTPSRESPELAAESIRTLALQGFDPSFLEPFIDPSQKWAERDGGPATGGVPNFIGAALIYFSRFEMLKAAVGERFGEEAVSTLESQGLYFQIEVIGNGVREMFAAHELKQINQIGPMAYVAPLDPTGEQIGYSLVFRENQGEWLWVMLDANTPWTTGRIGTLTGLIGKPLQDRGPDMAQGLERIAKGVRDGSISTMDATMAEVRALIDTQS